MLYAAMTFWLLVIVFVAWGVYQLWSSMVKPKVVNTILLPATLLAQLGRILGTLVTGGTVNQTTLMKDDDAGEPEIDRQPRSKIPVVGPILVAMLPLAACAIGVYWTTKALGGDVLSGIAGQAVSQSLPMSPAAFWTMLRDTITLMERLVQAMLQTDLVHWKTIGFLYLVICLTVRMAPFRDNIRGSLGAIILAGLLIAVIGSAAPGTVAAVRGTWTVLSFSVGMLMFLLMISLTVRGLVGLVKVLATQR